MTTLPIAAKWRERSRHQDGASASHVRAVTIAVLLSYGLVLASRANTVLPIGGSLLWSALPWWAPSTKVARLPIALGFGYAAMMLGICAWQTPLPPPLSIAGSYPFGEHPVTVVAGFPWPGVEGCRPWPLARDCVPFDMGVDAMLVNLTVFTVVIGWLLRRVRPEVFAGLLVAAAAVATACGLAGGYLLGVMFD